MITALIIDDEPSAIDVLQIHAEKVSNLKVLQFFHDPYKARDYLKNNPVDMIFLDINMPGLSGLQLLDQLSYRPLVVFTTAYSEYAVDSYDYKAVDYLLKPIEFDKFCRALKRVEEALSGQQVDHLSKRKNYIFLKDSYKQVKVFVDDIQYIQSDGNYINVYTNSKKVNTRLTLNQVLELLPSDSFIRVHNSSVVNILQIERLENNQIIIGNTKIAIGPSFKDSLQFRLGSAN